MARPIYMDYHATTPVDPRVVEAMLPYLTEHFGNASSRTHEFGWTASRAVDRARQQVADLIGARPREIVFTSGATESNNLALKGAMAANRSRGDHLITVVTEHKAVLDSCNALERDGCRVTRLPVGPDGRIDVQDVEGAVTSSTVLVSVMAANNEIGVLQPIAEIGALAKRRGLIFHTDAAQAVGKIPFDMGALQVDLASFTAHKIYGPKGVGALYVRRRDPRVALTAQQDGGGHEGGLRSGTLNVPGIVGLGKAAEICGTEGESEAARLAVLRNRLHEGLRARVNDFCVNGSMTDRLTNNLHVSFADVDGEALLMALTDIAVSSGAACTSARPEPPYVLKALGLDDDLARASIRFGLGRYNTVDEVDFVVGRVAEVVASLRRTSSRQRAGSSIAP